MTVKELNVGDVFRVVGETQRWRKATPRDATMVRQPRGFLGVPVKPLGTFRDKEIEVLARAAEIYRDRNTLVLRGGEVILEFQHPVRVHRCTPGDPHTELILSGSSFSTSTAKQPTAETALLFSVTFGGNHLNRPSGSDLIAYNGRVYGRATKKEVLGESKMGGYRLLRNVDGAKRLVIIGLLTVPSELALYDIIMEHFGPDTVPQRAARTAIRRQPR
jgi:hypothetical protein